jgi:hypothetical protein
VKETVISYRLFDTCVWQVTSRAGWRAVLGVRLGLVELTVEHSEVHA